ncbi:MAG: diacylglycerol kinase, partial [Gammaproteobacteria bacterium]
MNFSIAKRMQSFSHAFRGIGTLIETQHNAWIHLVVTITVVAISFLLELSGFEWVLIILAVTIVWLAEAMNTAIEFLSDTITELHHPL